MKDSVSQLLGRVSNQLHLEYVNSHADIFATQDLGVAITKKDTAIPGGQHIHSSYEFLILMDQPLLSRLEKKDCVIESGMVFPFNTEQYHGPKCSVDNFNSICINIEKDYISNMSKSIFGKHDIFFENRSFEFTSELKSLLYLFTDECKNKQSGYRFILQSLADSITVNLIRQTSCNHSLFQDKKCYSDKPFIKRVIDFLNENFVSEYSMDDLIKITNYSPYHFIRIFKSETGKTPFDYLMDIKVEKAKSQLMNNRNTIAEVSFACGFNNPDHFSCVFKQRTGLTPSAYRKIYGT